VKDSAHAQEPTKRQFQEMCEKNRWVGPDLEMLGLYPVTNMGDSIKKENNYFKTKQKSIQLHCISLNIT
jgi:hypothetical protein